MNSVSQTDHTPRFRDPAHTAALRRHWSALVRSPRSHDLTAAHHLLYAGLRGRDWRRAFTPISNPRKLANGGFFTWGLFRALGMLRSPSAAEQLLAPFDGLVTPDMLAQVRAGLPSLSPYRLDPQQIAAHGLPIAAYRENSEPAHG